MQTRGFMPNKICQSAHSRQWQCNSRESRRPTVDNTWPCLPLPAVLTDRLMPLCCSVWTSMRRREHSKRRYYTVMFTTTQACSASGQKPDMCFIWAAILTGGLHYLLVTVCLDRRIKFNIYFTVPVVIRIYVFSRKFFNIFCCNPLSFVELQSVWYAFGTTHRFHFPKVQDSQISYQVTLTSKTPVVHVVLLTTDETHIEHNVHVKPLLCKNIHDHTKIFNHTRGNKLN